MEKQNNNHVSVSEGCKPDVENSNEDVVLGKELYYKVSWSNYPVSIGATLNQYRKPPGFLTDVILICDHVKFNCHRIVLCASSDYFEKLFKDVMSENSVNQRIIVIGIRAEMMNYLLDCIYQGSTVIPNKFVEEFWKGVGILELKGFCEARRMYYSALEDTDTPEVEAQVLQTLDKLPLEQVMSVEEEVIEQRKVQKKKNPPKGDVNKADSADNTGHLSEEEIAKFPSLYDLVEHVLNSGDSGPKSVTEKQAGIKAAFRPFVASAEGSSTSIKASNNVSANKKPGKVNELSKENNQSSSSTDPKVFDLELRKQKLEQAITFAVKTESIMKACRKYGIPKSTLASNLKKRGLIPLKRSDDEVKKMKIEPNEDDLPPILEAQVIVEEEMDSEDLISETIAQVAAGMFTSESSAPYVAVPTPTTAIVVKKPKSKPRRRRFNENRRKRPVKQSTVQAPLVLKPIIVQTENAETKNQESSWSEINSSKELIIAEPAITEITNSQNVDEEEDEEEVVRQQVYENIHMFGFVPPNSLQIRPDQLNAQSQESQFGKQEQESSSRIEEDSEKENISSNVSTSIHLFEGSYN